MVLEWYYHNPVHIHAGSGLLRHLAEYVPPGRWLLVTTAGFTLRGMTEHIKILLPNVELLVHDQVTPNPELDDLESIIREYRSAGIDGILAVGGGEYNRCR